MRVLRFSWVEGFCQMAGAWTARLRAMCTATMSSDYLRIITRQSSKSRCRFVVLDRGGIPGVSELQQATRFPRGLLRRPQAAGGPVLFRRVFLIRCSDTPVLFLIWSSASRMMVFDLARMGFWRAGAWHLRKQSTREQPAEFNASLARSRTRGGRARRSGWEEGRALRSASRRQTRLMLLKHRPAVSPTRAGGESAHRRPRRCRCGCGCRVV